MDIHAFHSLLLASIRQLDRGQMEVLFPDAEIMAGRVFGMAKSSIAVRR